jgi:hypothetical protein
MMALMMAHSTTGQKLEVKLEYHKVVHLVLRWEMQTEASLDDQKSAERNEF